MSEKRTPDRITWGLPERPALPAAIAALADPIWRVRATEVRQRSRRLEVLLWAADAFQLSASRGSSLSDDVQGQVSAACPELSALQRVLDHVAARPAWLRCPAADPPDEPFPQEEYDYLFAGLPGLLLREARIVRGLGVHVDGLENPKLWRQLRTLSFRADPAPRRGERSVDPFGDGPCPWLMDGYLDIRPAVGGRVRRFRFSVGEFLDSLDAAPACALGLTGAADSDSAKTAECGTSGPRIVVDTAACRITFDGVTYEVTPNQAEAFDQLVQATGRPVALTQLIGPKVHRDCRKLPEVLAELIHTKPGAGSWIDREYCVGDAAPVTRTSPR